MIKIVFDNEGFVLINPNEIRLLEFNKQNKNVAVRFINKTSCVYENVINVLNASVKVINRN
jgi:hypothetical protein